VKTERWSRDEEEQGISDMRNHLHQQEEE